jgi:hypothetical protein
VVNQILTFLVRLTGHVGSRKTPFLTRGRSASKMNSRRHRIENAALGDNAASRSAVGPHTNRSWCYRPDKDRHPSDLPAQENSGSAAIEPGSAARTCPACPATAGASAWVTKAQHNTAALTRPATVTITFNHDRLTTHRGKRHGSPPRPDTAYLIFTLQDIPSPIPRRLSHDRVMSSHTSHLSPLPRLVLRCQRCGASR